MFTVVGIVANPERKEVLEFSKKLLRYLEKKKLKVFLEPKLASYVNNSEYSQPLEKMKVDLIITIGGDGTILKTCLGLPNPEPPILTINMGFRGFLTEVLPREAFDALDKCLEGNYLLERYLKLTSFIAGVRQPDALNEVFISSRALAKTLYINIQKDDENIVHCQGDGVVVSSHAGSTGYSLSAGGSILDPELNAFILTPVCPLTVFHPIVFPASSKITIELIKPKTANVVIDGHYQTIVNAGNPRITIKKSENETRLIRFNKNFYRRLKEKLLLYRGKDY